MCLILPSRIVAVSGQQAEIQTADGTRALVSTTLTPEVAIGQHVLVDRGLVLKVIEAAEAEAILALYAELDGLVAGPDGEAEVFPA